MRKAPGCQEARLVPCAVMQVDLPDPTYTGTARARANFRLAVRIAAGFVAVLWLIQLVNWGVDVGPEYFGIRPREVSGLPGIVFAPLLHGGFAHLVANTLPLLVLLTVMLHLYPHSALVVLPVIYLGPGVAVWSFAGTGVHIGASGLVYGLVSYILVAGLIRRDRRAIAASLMVSFMYGALVWGVLPIQRGVSWETHLAAALIGVVLAIALRRRDIPPRKRYTWENEGDSGDPRDGNDRSAPYGEHEGNNGGESNNGEWRHDSDPRDAGDRSPARPSDGREHS